MANSPVNYVSQLGIGLEGTPGTPVKAQNWLDFTSETLKGISPPIRRKAITGTRSVKGAVMGAYEEAGDINLEVTPDKITKLLHAALPCVTTGTTDPYTHVFKTGNALSALTAVLLRSNYWFIYSALYIQRISIKAVVDQIMEATFSLQGRAEEKVYDNLTASSGGDGADILKISDSGIAYSALDPFVFWEGAVTLHTGATTDTNNWNLNIATGLQRVRSIAGTRAHNRAHPGDSVVSGSFDLVFDTIEEHRRFMGAASSSYPIATGNALQKLAIDLLFTASGTRTLEINIPQAYYEASGPEVKGREGVVMQPITFNSLYDSGSSSDVTITILNEETDANITTAGTNIT